MFKKNTFSYTLDEKIQHYLAISNFQKTKIDNYQEIAKLVLTAIKSNLTTEQKLKMKMNVVYYYFNKILNGKISKDDIIPHQKIMNTILGQWPEIKPEPKNILMYVLGGIRAGGLKRAGVEPADKELAEGMKIIEKFIKMGELSGDYYSLSKFLTKLSRNFNKKEQKMILKWCEKNKIIDIKDARELLKMIENKDKTNDNEFMGAIKYYFEVDKARNLIKESLNSPNKNNNLKI